jgi:alpha-beta hydrolase superfamily lysophospholipase
MKLDLVTLTMPRGSIAALDYEPRRPRNIGIVAGHGYSSSKHNLDSLCAFLASHGFHVASIDFPGHKLGASGGRLDTPEDLTDAMAAAVAYVRERHTPDVYVLGHSMGATTALRAAAADQHVLGAVSIATGYGRPAVVEGLAAKSFDLRAEYVDGLSLPDLAAQSEPLLEAALPKLAGRPVLYVAAERDMLVSRRSVDELYERAPEPKQLVTVASDHTYAGENSRAAVVAWLNERHAR